ncbi:hypothetical protein AB4Y45_07340 [Paraburkholderia sp. EG287A]|uniref:hypothetical protein n=1 Tax=unclassified Paraburkholderia TaxID=2615204 RepID=UPI0034D1CEC7
MITGRISPDISASPTGRGAGSICKPGPRDQNVLLSTATDTERDVIGPFFEWRRNGVPARNNWNRSTNNAQTGLDAFDLVVHPRLLGKTADSRRIVETTPDPQARLTSACNNLLATHAVQPARG